MRQFDIAGNVVMHSEEVGSDNLQPDVFVHFTDQRYSRWLAVVDPSARQRASAGLDFMAIQPVTDGHLLVIPKRHAPYLTDLDEQLGMSMFRVGQRLAAALRPSGLPCEGVNLLLADGEVAFQEVFHVHLHVFPRTPGDGFHIDADWRQRPSAELDDASERIRSGMATWPS